MVTFELGNPDMIRELTSKEWNMGKFVFRKDDTHFRLFLGNFLSHPNLVEGLNLLAEREIPRQHIWGGGAFEVDKRKLRFSSSSGYYGRVPNSFLIACCKQVRIPNIELYTFALTPYDAEDPQLKERRKTWRALGDFELDTEEREYVFDRDMNPISVS